MRNLLQSYILANYYRFMSDNNDFQSSTKEENVHYSFRSYSKQLGEDDVNYYVELEYFNDDYKNISKTVKISSEELLVYLFTKR